MSIRSLGIPEYKAPKDRILLGIIMRKLLIVVSYINMMFDFGLRCFLNVVKYKYKSKESEDDMLCLYQN